MFNKFRKSTLTEHITKVFPTEKCRENNDTLTNAIWYLMGMRYILGFQNTELDHLMNTYMNIEKEYLDNELSIIDEMKARIGM